VALFCVATPSREGSDWIQRDLLLAEGISVDAAGRLPLARHRWRPQENCES
jgi:methylated-DNA-protein-cysteine methyltransferase-like protein